MKWRKEPPDKPGWWWCRAPVGGAFIVHCMTFYNESRMLFWDGPKAEYCDTMPEDYEWAGPIEEPKEKE